MASLDFSRRFGKGRSRIVSTCDRRVVAAPVPLSRKRVTAGSSYREVLPRICKSTSCRRLDCIRATV